jgi:hypothetical protein
MKIVKVKIDALGNSTVEADGFQGQSCIAATGPIEAALAGTGGMDREFKPEWALPETTEQGVEQRIGF